MVFDRSFKFESEVRKINECVQVLHVVVNVKFTHVQF